MTNKYTYAIFSARYAPLTGGIETFTERLAHELVQVGNRVFVVTSQFDSTLPDHEKLNDGVEVVRLPSRSFLNARLPISKKTKAYKTGLAKLESAGIDRVLVNARFYRNSLEGVRFARRLGVPVVVLDHGSAHLTIGNKAADWFIERYEHAISRRIKRLQPAFAGISTLSASWLGHFDIETSLVIPNAIDVGAFRALASQHSYRSEFGISEKQIIVVFAGRLEPEKGAYEYARAAALLGDDFACFMAGDGSLRARIEEIGADNLFLLGRIDSSDLSSLFREADVFCLPSRSEGFCTSLLEAAAQGAIPVMPHVGGTDEVMGWDPVRFGVLLDGVDPASIAKAIREASVDEELVRGDLIRHVSEQCSWLKTVDALEKAFAAAQS